MDYPFLTTDWLKILTSEEITCLQRLSYSPAYRAGEKFITRHQFVAGQMLTNKMREKGLLRLSPNKTQLMITMKGTEVLEVVIKPNQAKATTKAIEHEIRTHPHR